jgi:aspartate/methionine/tyrosine aminotransferase
MPDFSQRVKAISPPPIDIITQEVAKIRRSGIEVINLGQAVCNLPLPECLLVQRQESLNPRIINSYTPVQGLPALRERIALRYRETFKVPLNPATEI